MTIWRLNRPQIGHRRLEEQTYPKLSCISQKHLVCLSNFLLQQSIWLLSFIKPTPQSWHNESVLRLLLLLWHVQNKHERRRAKRTERKWTETRIIQVPREKLVKEYVTEFIFADSAENFMWFISIQSIVRTL